MRKLFIVWNRTYRQQCVVARDANEAVQIAVSTRHITRPDRYRKIKEATQDFHGNKVAETALAGDQNGILRETRDGWEFHPV
jgi:hypothetical protein